MDIEIFLKKFKSRQINTEEYKQYLGGFLDGDGSIFSHKGVISVNFSQSEISVLETINQFYGRVSKVTNYKNSDINQRNQFQLRFTGKTSYHILEDLKHNCIIKNEQVCLAIDSICTNDKEEKNKLEIEIKRLNGEKNGKNKRYDLLSIGYIAGLFDADGSIGIYGEKNKMVIKITQKNDPDVIEKIRDLFYPEAKIDSRYILRFYKKSIMYQFLKDIEPYLVYKKDQVRLGIFVLGQILSYESTLSIAKKMKELKKKDYDKDFYINRVRELFEDLYNYSTEDLIKDKKYKEICNTNVDKYIENKIYNHHETLDLKLKLIFCESKTQNKIWLYIRNKTSSIAHSGGIGRNVKILILDENTGKYIGTMSLSSDIYNVGPRDKFLKEKGYSVVKSYIQKIANLSCCVPVQPFGYNTNGAKLLVNLAFSKEVFDYWFKKYKEPLLAISTMSINGKSIVYDRVMKLIGYTKGESAYHIPKKIIDVCKILHNYLDLTRVRNGTYENLLFLFDKSGIDRKYLNHGKKKGYYFKWVFSTEFSNDYDITELKSVDEVYISWKKRWAEKRFNRIEKKSGVQVYTKDNFPEFKKYVFLDISFIAEFSKNIDIQNQEAHKKPEIKKRTYMERKNLSIEQERILCNLKEENTSQEASLKFKEHTGMLISRSNISKYWSGNTPIGKIKETSEYKNMINISKKRTYKNEKSELWVQTISETNKVKRRNFTEEQLMNILQDKHNLSINSTDVGKKYIGKNGSCLSRQSVEKIWNGDTKPLVMFDGYDEIISYKRNVNVAKSLNISLSKRKYTDDLISQILMSKLEKTPTKDLVEKYNVSTSVIKNIWGGITRPLHPEKIKNYEELIKTRKKR